MEQRIHLYLYLSLAKASGDFYVRKGREDSNKTKAARQRLEWAGHGVSRDLTRTKPIFQSFLSTEGPFSGKLTKLSLFCLRKGWRWTWWSRLLELRLCVDDEDQSLCGRDML